MITDTRTHRLAVFSMVMASLALVVLSPVMAAPAVNILVSGEPAAKNCGAVPLPSVSEPVIIDWDPVTDQFFVQRGDVKFAVDLPPTVTGGAFKLFEIHARATASLNNTAVENCFAVQ